MSQAVYPELQGKSIEVTKIPMWKTVIQQIASGKETRNQQWSYPKYQIKLSYEFLTDSSFSINALNKSDYETIVAFYNARGGAFDDFLYEDPIDNTVTAQSIGIANGVETQFQLVRAVSTWIEPIFGVKGTPTIKVGSTTVTNYTINNYGLVTFTTPPASGTISWTGQYYFRVRFLNDSMEFKKFLYSLYSCDSVELITVKV